MIFDFWELLIGLKKIVKMKDKLTIIVGVAICTAFLLGLATTLTRSMMIGFFDVLPVYILMGIVIVMMFYEAFYDNKK